MNITVKTSNDLYEAVKKAEETTENITIMIKSGEYEIPSTIYLKNSITIAGEENVVLKGTKRIPIDNAEKVGGMYKIKLSEFGITDTGEFGLGPYRDYWKEYDIPKPHMTDCGPSMELYFENKKMNLSRYPREGFTRIKKAVGEISMYLQNERCGSEDGVFIPSETEIFDNNDTENMLLVGYWSMDYAIERHLIKNYDKASKTIEVKKPYHVYGYRDGNSISGEIGGKFYVLNVLSEVKKYGDWCIDRKKNELYFIPFKGQDYIDIAICENMFEAENKENITVENINIFGCRKSAFQFTGCKNITIKNCQMNDLGAWGAICDNCESSTVEKCHIYNTGGGGIAMSGGDRATLTSSKNMVSLNEIHNIAYWHKTYLAAIEMNGVNVIASENEIYDVPHFAIVYQGNEHIIEKNHIRNACYESNDAGAIYAGRDYTCQGTIIRYNHLENMVGFENRGCIGIYFDDGMCTAEVYGNVLINMPYVAILIGGGRNFDVHDNYFRDCKMTVMFDNRLDRWASGNSKLVKHLKEVPYRSEIWKKAYPYLYKILEDEPTLPKYNKFYNNTIVGGKGVGIYNENLTKFLDYHDNKFIPTEKIVGDPSRRDDWFYLK